MNRYRLAIFLGSLILFACSLSVLLGVFQGLCLSGLLLIHEAGHLLALRRKGFATPWPVFIPFIGAFIFLPPFEDRDTEAYVGYGGPFIGSLAAIAVGVLFCITGDKAWLTASVVALILNLFNMIPIEPLDGGRITQAIHGKFKYVGFAILLMATIVSREPSLLILWMGVVLECTTIKLKKRLAVATGIWVIMTGTIFMAGHRPILISLSAVLVGLFFCIQWFRFLRSTMAHEKEHGISVAMLTPDLRPACPAKRRLGWLCAWFLLLAVQLAVITFEISLLRQ